MKAAWLFKAKGRYRDMMSDIKTEGKKPDFVSEDSWENWKQKWNTQKFKKFVIETLKTGSPRPLLMGLHDQLTQEAQLPIMSMGND